jgi:hypothetical protein
MLIPDETALLEDYSALTWRGLVRKKHESGHSLRSSQTGVLVQRR